MSLSRILWVPIGVTVVALACSTDGGGDGGVQVPADGEEACFNLSKICHGFNDEGPLDDCHELGHAFEGPACKQQYVECITLCEAAEKPAAPEAGPAQPDGSREGGAEASTQPADARQSEAGPVADSGGPDATGDATDSAPTHLQDAAPEASPEAAPVVDSGPDIPPEELCFELSKICHGLAGERLEDCHDIGHADDTDVCLENIECVQLCRVAADD